MEDLPTDFMVRWISNEREHAMVMMEEGDKGCCGECLAETEAVGGCEDCCTFLCSFHVKNHDVSRSLCDHHVRHGVEAFREWYCEKASGCGERSSPMCSVHDDRRLELFCTKCDEAVCVKCMVSEHVRHEFVEFADVMEKKRMGLRNHVLELSRHGRVLDECASGVSRRRQCVEDKYELEVGKVDEWVNEMIAAVRARGDELKLNLSVIRDGRQRVLVNQENEVKSLSDECKRCVLWAGAVEECGGYGEMVEACEYVCDEWSWMRGGRRADMLCVMDGDEFGCELDVDELMMNVSECGRVLDGDVCVEKCVVDGFVGECVVGGVGIEMVVSTMDRDGESVSVCEDDVSVRVDGVLDEGSCVCGMRMSVANDDGVGDGDVCDVLVRSHDDHVSVWLTPHVVGEYTVSVCIRGEGVPNSPFMLRAVDWDWSRGLVHQCVVGSYGNGVEQFSYPWGICTSTDGQWIYVADCSNKRVKVMHMLMTMDLRLVCVMMCMVCCVFA